MKERRTDGKCRDGGVVGRRSKVYDQRGMDPRWKAELMEERRDGQRGRRHKKRDGCKNAG